MDSDVEDLDNSNMHSKATPRAQSVPRYGLYGEQPLPPPVGMLHCESIAARSRLYDWEIAPHVHELFLQILYVRAGSGTALLDDAALPIRAPCVIVVPASRLHGFHFSPHVDGMVFTASQDQIEGWPTLRAAGLDPGVMSAEMIELPRTRERVAFEQTFAMLAEEVGGSATLHLRAAQSLFTLALVRILRVSGQLMPDKWPHSPRTDRHIRRFLALVDERFRRHHAVEDYARALGITPTQLGRITRRQLGRTPLQVLNARLLREAQCDLVYTGLSIKAIALELGFEDPAYFSRFFQHHTGQAPRDFRATAHRALQD